MERPKGAKRLEVVTSPPKGSKVLPKNVGQLSLVYDEETGRTTKRPRRDSIDRAQVMADSGTRLLRKVARLVKNLGEDMKGPAQLIRENANTKKEIKEKAARMASDISQLNTEEVRRVLEEATIEEGQQEEGKSHVREEAIGILEAKMEKILAAVGRIESGQNAHAAPARGPDTATSGDVQAGKNKMAKKITEGTKTATKSMAEAVKEGSGRNEDWTVVENRRSTTKKTRTIRPRAERVMVETEGSTYADTLR